jgi:hypothetical protein
MIKQLVGGLAVAALVVGASASAANAQCAFQHPKKAKQFKGAFVQAMVSCGTPTGSQPNATAGGAVPACQPVITFNEENGSPPNGWLWERGGVATGVASVQFKALKKNAFPETTPADPNAADIKVQLKCKGIVYAGIGAPNAVQGTLETVTRTTFNDRTGGDMTVVDFALKFQFDVFDGACKLKTSANRQLNNTPPGLAGLPHCTSIETLKVRILDENGAGFGTVGLFLP